MLCAVSKKGQELNKEEIGSCIWFLFEVTGYKASKASQNSQRPLKRGGWLTEKTLKAAWL